MDPLPELDAVLKQLRDRGVSIPAGNRTVTAYGDSPEMSAALLRLIASGQKRAGTALVWALEADEEQHSQPGDIEIVLEFDGTPAIVTRIVECEVVPFDTVTAAYAAIEGEGDGSLEYWRRTHWEFFGRECTRIGRVPSRQMPVLCAIFEVVEVIARSEHQ